VRHHGHSPFLLSPALDFAFRLTISVFASTFAGELALSDTLCLAAAAAAAAPSPPSPGSLRPAASLAHLVSPAPAQPSTSLRHQNPQSTTVNRCGKRSLPLGLTFGRNSNADIFIAIVVACAIGRASRSSTQAAHSAPNSLKAQSAVQVVIELWY